MSAFNKFSEEIINLKLPHYEDLPNIDLYMDQLISYIESVLAPLQPYNKEKPLTTAMVNNYVKQGFIPPTNKKRYNKKHLAYLIVVCILKPIYTISEISELIEIQAGCSELYVAYDYFCSELELALNAVFTQQPMPVDTAKTQTEQRVFVRNSVIAVANKLYIQKLMAFLNNK